MQARLRRDPRLLDPLDRNLAPQYIRILPGFIPQDGHVPTEAPEDPVESQQQTPTVVGSRRDRCRDRSPFEGYPYSSAADQF